MINLMLTFSMPRIVLRRDQLQAALAIRGFGIRGFDYSRFAFCYPDLVSADFWGFSLDYSRFFISVSFFIIKKLIKI